MYETVVGKEEDEKWMKHVDNIVKRELGFSPSNASEQMSQPQQAEYEVIVFHEDETKGEPTRKEREEIVKETEEILAYHRDRIEEAKAQSLRDAEDDPEDDEKEDDSLSYRYYTVTAEDTLFSLAMREGISPSIIQTLNSFSGDMIYPGQLLRLPSQDRETEVQDIPVVDDEQKEEARRELIKRQCESAGEIFKTEVAYCTPQGEISGTLTITQTMVMFDPDIQDKTNQEKVQSTGMIRFQFLVDVADITDVMMLVLPPTAEEMEENVKMDILIQLDLINVGNKKMNKEFEKKLRVLQKERLSIATIHIKLIDKGPDAKLHSEVERRKRAVTLVEKIAKASKDNARVLQVKKSATYVPFFSVVEENVKGSTKEETRANYEGFLAIKRRDSYSERNSRSLSNALSRNQFNEKNEEKKEEHEEKTSSTMYANEEEMDVAPEMSCESEVASSRQIMQIVKFLPALYKTKSWGLAYSRTKHGTSLQLLYRSARIAEKNILLIRDGARRVFGAFCPEAWHIEGGYYGSGEAFLFKFEENDDNIKVFHWTGMNNFIMYADSDGFGIGADPGYGLFVDKELLQGQSVACETFANEILASSSSFDIAKLEIWALVDCLVEDGNPIF
eukprot:TRINITY_DN10942_c0_g9_i1.p1 TRINITY_DN10942_c0_g9~~TRINITY_DN10942_c0_g9_i1.p1  ORF type:complete len:618 (-),score=131.03 TRINITY_DN10942_c0_g9_i1:1051-2904(-)